MKYTGKLSFCILAFGMTNLYSPITTDWKEDYTEYDRQIARAENELYKEHFQQALSIYKGCFENYDFIHANDAYTACQLAAYLKNRADFEKLVYRTFKQGVNYRLVRRNKNTGPFLSGKDSANYLNLYASARKEYYSRLDLPLRKEWAERFNCEQESKGKKLVFMQIRDDNFARLKELIKQHRFPGERLIGIAYTLPGYKNESNRYNDMCINYSFVFPTLLHVQHAYSQLENTLKAEVKNGNISPYDLTIVYGAEQARMGTWYPAGIGVDTVKLPLRLNNFVFRVFCKDTARVNHDRRLMNMADYVDPNTWVEFTKKFHFDMYHY